MHFSSPRIRIVSPRRFAGAVKDYFSDEPSPTLECVELRVHMDCPGSERTVRKALSKMSGVHSIEVDREQQKVTVTGYVDKYKVLRRLRRKGKIAELWYDELNGSESLTQTAYYRRTPGAYTYESTLPYALSTSYGRYDAENTDDLPLGGALSDDNPNNCTIM